jgi:hypothetical protein
VTGPVDPDEFFRSGDEAEHIGNGALFTEGTWSGMGEPSGRNGTDPNAASDADEGAAYAKAVKDAKGIALAWDVWAADRIYAELPPIDWIVEGIIPAGSLGMICAYGSSLKSWAELDLLDALARGRKWLGLFQCTTAGKVFLLDYEAGSYEVRRRLQAIARGLSENGELEQTPNIRFVTMPPTRLPDADFIARLEPFARECKIICIDTLAAGSPGVDENDARFAMPLNALKALAERSGCAIVVLHHTRKPTDGEDERATTRGTSAIFNALDWELKLSRSKDNERMFVCKSDKARNMKAPDPFVVRVEDVTPFAVRVLGEALAAAPTGKADDALRGAVERRRIADLEGEIVKAIVESKNDVSGWRRIRDALRGRGVSFTDKELGPAVHNVLASGRVVNKGTDRAPKWAVRAP